MLTYQYYRDNPKEFDKYAGKDLVPLNCSNCGKEFTKRKRLARNAVEYDKSRKAFCSRECFSKTVNTSVSEACANCNNLVTRALSERKKTKNIFCNQSCAASYNNKHKTYGTRRSKLEVFLEEQLRILYPNLQIIANGKEAIESELDFYFPELRFAIELNGPTHYEPIYGTDKFEKILGINNTNEVPLNKNKFLGLNKWVLISSVILISGAIAYRVYTKKKYYEF
jgi:hypothetical protein